MTLDEIVIQNFNVRDTVAKAIERIDNNYLNIAHNSFGFLRQSIQEDSLGVELIEADFISYQKDYRSNYKTKIIEAKKTRNHSELGIKTHGGTTHIINEGDLVKNKKRHPFLSIKEMDNYIFSYKGTIKHNDINAYLLKFNPANAESLDHYQIGEVYIDVNSLAFMELRFISDENKMAAKNAVKQKADL